MKTQKQENLLNHILENKIFLEALKLPTNLFDNLFEIHYNKK